MDAEATNAELLRRIAEGGYSDDDRLALEALAPMVVEAICRKRSSEALRQSEARYRLLYENLHDAFVQVAMDGRIIEFNDRYCQMTGYKAEELRALRYQDLTPQRWHAFEQEIVVEQIIPAGYSTVYEKEYRCKNGTIIPVELRTILSRDEAGQPESMWAIVRHIGQRKAAEQALRDSEQRYRGIFENAAVGIAEVTCDATIVSANDSLARMLGYSRDELIGRAVAQISHPVDDELDAEYGRRLLDGQIGRYTIEKRYVRKDGTLLWGQLTAGPVRDETGRISAIIGIIEDITARKRAEENLREANELLEQKVADRTAELANRAAQLRALAGELTLSEQRERRRMAGLLHDHLQQLLVAAKFRSIVLGRARDRRTKAAAGEIERLIDESIAASRSLTAELSPPVLHEGGLVAGLQWLARWMAQKHGLAVEMSADEADVALAEDLKVLLFESVRELLFNAVKHSQTRHARMDVRNLDANLRVVVSDDGSGFDPASVRPGGEGGGFGLFSIRERLDLIGGRMEIDSAPGRGSRFVLTVPMADDPVVCGPRELAASPDDRAARLPSSAAIQERPAAGVTGKRFRVLLADDHAVVRGGLARLLAEEPDIEVIGEAGNGLEAVELAGRLRPDVILMDLSMPRMGGIAATRAIRKSYPDIRIIGLSMFEQADRAQAMGDAGVDVYLTKSGESADLIAAIRQVARKADG